jgi:hypothetical protein
VVGNAIFLTTSDVDAQTQTLIKFDRATGKLRGQVNVHRGGMQAKIHPNNSFASPSPAYDGKHVIVSFHQSDAIVATAFTVDGKQVWQTRVCTFRPVKYEFGYGASPIVVNDLVVIAAEFDGADSGIYALDSSTGKQRWRIPRKSNLSFASPIVANMSGKPSLLIAGESTVSAYDPKTGKVMWSAPAATDAICGTCIWDDEHVAISGGFPEEGTWCVSAKGGHQLVWNNPVKCYEQSLLLHEGYIYALADSGVAYCWRLRDGKEMWRERVSRGRVSASPLWVDGKVVMADEAGNIYVLAAKPDQCEKLAAIRTGESIFASPVALPDGMLVRTAVQENGRRQEYLVSIASNGRNQ